MLYCSLVSSQLGLRAKGADPALAVHLPWNITVVLTHRGLSSTNDASGQTDVDESSRW
jgi:hypothetical protein